MTGTQGDQDDVPDLHKIDYTDSYQKILIILWDRKIDKQIMTATCCCYGLGGTAIQRIKVNIFVRMREAWSRRLYTSYLKYINYQNYF